MIMRYISIIFLFIHSFSYGQTHWKNGILEDEFISAQMPFPESHAATIAEIPGGLAVAWFGGTKERNPDVEIWFSKKITPGKWTKPISIANGIVNDTLRYACWNPVLYQVPNGDLLLFYKVGPNVSAWKGWMKRSSDGGSTWSLPIALPENCLGPIKNKPVLLPNGTLLAPSSTEGKGWKLHMEFSLDQGKTWSRGADLAVADTTKVLNAIQPSILMLKDGRLMLLARTQQKQFAQSFSADWGKTWSPITLSTVPNNNSGSDGVTLKSGQQLLVYNHVLVPDSIKNGKGARTPLNVAVSNDGLSWQAALILEDSPISQYSYPSVIQSSDGFIHIVYTWRRENIKYVKIDPEQLKTAPFLGKEWPTKEANIGNTADAQFQQLLSDVLLDIQQKYKISIRYPADLVQGKLINYAQWRYRPDVEKTLESILSPLDISFAKDGDRKYKLQAFQYHLKTPDEGKEQLKALASLYASKQEWEGRAAALRSCIIETLGLNKLPQTLFSTPQLSKERIFTDYSVQNFTLEVLKGVYFSGSIYRPLHVNRSLPLILHPDGHFAQGRYRPDGQFRAATLARMGMVSVSYDLFGWDGESQLQMDPVDHRRSLVQTLQLYSTRLLLNWLLEDKTIDPTKVAITGASGGGSHTIFMAALDPRITASIPVAMMSSYHSGGCPCESGMGIHLCVEGTNNVEIAGLMAPKPQLIISDGKDWTQQNPTVEIPFLERIYQFYGRSVQHRHFTDEGHDYGPNKRQAMYRFLAETFKPLGPLKEDATHLFSEQGVIIEPVGQLKYFGADGSLLPKSATKGWTNIEQQLKSYLNK